MFLEYNQPMSNEAISFNQKKAFSTSNKLQFFSFDMSMVWLENSAFNTWLKVLNQEFDACPNKSQ